MGKGQGQDRLHNLYQGRWLLLVRYLPLGANLQHRGTAPLPAQGLYFGRAQHRSGSILAITVKNGTFKEKRHFDAWEGQGLKKAKNLAY